MEDDQEKSLQETIEHLSSRIDRQNELIALWVKNQSSFKARLAAGLWTGLGTVLGATVLVYLVVLVLKPLSKTDWIGPIVDKVISALENRGAGPRSRRVDRAPNNSDNQYNTDSN